MTRTGMRSQIFPIDVSGVLSQISAFDILEMINGYLADGSKASTLAHLRAQLTRFSDRLEFHSAGGLIGSLERGAG